ncbi:bifunctional 3,4-dihydroxy-2-butanone-4-phosphate synthase/GTP cyclohydrolase II [Carnimonas bestiolae]|uniref:bifunctional 3,4-dihydroxy-2-butanone-4-phosphate synthase/GTP cyclohydrolase II n=1 Tax=Carnimonas bestiolae TaxID=3402172 RepID=UPI003EDB7F51
MALSSVADLVSDIAQGKMVILLDDEGRENEGDVIIAAECVEAEHINFMARHARGLICMPLSRQRAKQLGLDLMVRDNGSGFGTKFTVSIEAANGITTGISAADRARTIRVAAARGATASDIVQPGHVFPLISEDGGVLRRAGHTEAACDLAAMAGFEPAGVICEVMNDDGTMARREDLEAFAAEHDIRIGTIADLIEYRIHHQQTITEVSAEPVNTAFGEFMLHTFKDSITGRHHLALVNGQPHPEQTVTVRVHVPDSLRDILMLDSSSGGRSWSGSEALEVLSKQPCGVLVLLDEGGTPLDYKTQLDIFFGRRQLPRDSSQDASGQYLAVGTGAQILRALGVGRMRLLTSPLRFSALAGFGLEVVEQVGCDTVSSR